MKSEIPGIKRVIRGMLRGSKGIVMMWDVTVVKSTGCSPRGSKFNSQKSHSGSQPSIIEFDAFFWHASVHADRALMHKK